MTPIRKQKFAEAYLECQSATKAAIAAGYSAKSAAREGSRLLKDREVKAAVKQAVKRSEKAAAWNIGRASKLLEENMEFAKQHANPASINKSVELICKLHGLFPPEKSEVALEGEARHVIAFKEFKEKRGKKGGGE